MRPELGENHCASAAECSRSCFIFLFFLYDLFCVSAAAPFSSSLHCAALVGLHPFSRDLWGRSSKSKLCKVILLWLPLSVRLLVVFSLAFSCMFSSHLLL